jgi:hypothetical protein
LALVGIHQYTKQLVDQRSKKDVHQSRRIAFAKWHFAFPATKGTSCIVRCRSNFSLIFPAQETVCSDCSSRPTPTKFSLPVSSWIPSAAAIPFSKAKGVVQYYLWLTIPC